MIDKAKQISSEMMTQRGYVITEVTDDIIKSIKPDGTVISVYFNVSEKLNKSVMTKYMSIMNKDNIKHAVIIYNDKVTTTTLNSINQSPDIKLELFSINELQYNITKHRLQPKSFRQLTPSEASEFKNKYGLKFPVMRYCDSIARFYAYDKGDVIEIVNKNDIVTYRIVK